jgi:hypothetical protein
MRHLITTTLLAGWLLTTHVVAQDGADEQPNAATFDAPKVAQDVTQDIIKRNIFLGDRSAVARAVRPPTPPVTPPTPPTTTTTEPPAPPVPADPDASFVLVGVTVLDGKPTAFIEDRSGGPLRTIAEPGEFSKGQITAIDLKGVTYVIGEETRTIEPRYAFTGKPPATVTSIFTGGSAPSTTSGGGGITSDTAATSSSDGSTGQRTMSLLERMRLRRQQESQPTPPRE